MFSKFVSIFGVRIVFSMLMVVGLAACGGGGGGDDDEVQLPDGVVIKGELLGGSYDAANEEIDTSNYVRITLAFENSTDKQQIVTIPACFTFVDPSAVNQDGLNIWRREVVVPAKSVYRLKLGTYCMNSSRHVPSGGVEYQLGGKTDNKSLQKVCDILKKKTLTRDSSIQSIVWSITNGGDLSDEDIDLLKALADGKMHSDGDAGSVSKAELLKRWLASRL